MATDIETLEDQAEKLKNAVRALASLTRPPQERIDRALSYFSRTFRSPPEGAALAAYEAVYRAIGDPPGGTTLCVRNELLKDDERETITTSLVDLLDDIVRQLEQARQALAANPPAPVDPIVEGPLESLVPARSLFGRS